MQQAALLKAACASVPSKQAPCRDLRGARVWQMTATRLVRHAAEAARDGATGGGTAAARMRRRRRRGRQRRRTCCDAPAPSRCAACGACGTRRHDVAHPAQRVPLAARRRLDVAHADGDAARAFRQAQRGGTDVLL
jgi:hypothetical protein